MMSQISSSANRKRTTLHYPLSCGICKTLKFSSEQEFIDHLRSRHSVKEGGSYVCKYGANNVCPSLPVEGVSDSDFTSHIWKDHLGRGKDGSLSGSRSMEAQDFSASTSDASPHQPQIVKDNLSSRYCSSQNLPAVLNDPRKTRREVAVFFIRHWGESYCEKADAIPASYHLPKIGPQHFEDYLRSAAKRYRRHVRDRNKIAKKSLSLSLVPFQLPSPNSAINRRGPIQLDLSEIPSIFLDSKFDLHEHAYFNAIFMSESFQLRSGEGTLIAKKPPSLLDSPKSSAENRPEKLQTHKFKLLADKLSHHLDAVEVQIARQISNQSPAFFHAMASHDVLQDHLEQTKSAVVNLRQKMSDLDNYLVKQSVDLLRAEKYRSNSEKIFERLKLIETVKEAQPNIQTLLARSDYIVALYIVRETQDLLRKDLSRIVSFRHLGQQLTEYEKLISMMLQAEFVDFIKTQMSVSFQNDDPSEHVAGIENQLTPLILGFLQLREFRFVDVIKSEACSTAKILLRDVVRNCVEGSEVNNDPTSQTSSLAEQMRQLEFSSWMEMLETLFSQLLQFCKSIQMLERLLIEIINDASNLKAKEYELVVTDADRLHLEHEICEISSHVCTFAQERCVKVLAARSKSVGFMEGLKSDQFLNLTRCIENFVVQCEEIAGRKLTALRAWLHAEISKFVTRFHETKKQKLGLILDSENWKQAEVPQRFQQMIDRIQETGELRKSPRNAAIEQTSAYLTLNGHQYALVGTALMFLEIIVEYCQCVKDLPGSAGQLFNHLIELLKYFNSRTCQLILGAGALQLVGLKTISTRNLALTSRCLQLIIAVLPPVQKHFESHLPDQQRHLMKYFNQVIKDYSDHVEEIFQKLVSIMEGLFEMSFKNWEMKSQTPTPTPAMQQLCRHIKKLYENVKDLLPQDQIQTLFFRIHDCFKGKLKQRLQTESISISSGASYSFVCSEFSYYMDNVRAVPCCSAINESLTEVLSDYH